MSNGKSIRKALNATFIKYYPELGKLFDSIAAAVLLKQIDYLFHANGDAPFYMFKEPCENSKYITGNSWVEMLGISRHEFNSALAKIGAVKVTKGVSLTTAKEESLVVYWTDKNRLTWYWLNVEKYLSLLDNAFAMKDEKPDLLYKAEKRIYIVNQENGFTSNKKDIKKDIKKEEEEPPPPKSKPKKVKQPTISKTETVEPEAIPEIHSEFVWRLKHTNEPERKAKLEQHVITELKNKLPERLGRLGYHYTPEQIEAFINDQIIKKGIDAAKTQFYHNGDIGKCDTVDHIINSALYQVRELGGLSIPVTVNQKTASKQPNRKSPFF